MLYDIRLVKQIFNRQHYSIKDEVTIIMKKWSKSVCCFFVCLFVFFYNFHTVLALRRHCLLKCSGTIYLNILLYLISLNSNYSHLYFWPSCPKGFFLFMKMFNIYLLIFNKFLPKWLKLSREACPDVKYYAGVKIFGFFLTTSSILVHGFAIKKGQRHSRCFSKDDWLSRARECETIRLDRAVSRFDFWLIDGSRAIIWDRLRAFC